ncbi:MAG: CPBP family intramembrane metalloprotease [Roseburia sp.]|nr:CPBP family intramembrane metalloprotease [Roseburia sp.]
MTERRKKIFIFIGIEFVLNALCSLPLFLLHAGQGSPQMLLASVTAMFLPAITTLITRRLTHDNRKLPLKLNLKRSYKQYLLAAFLPGVLILCGATLYFALFPEQLDLSLSYAKQFPAAGGQAVELPRLTVPVVVGLGLAIALFAPLVFVNHVLAFGEEIGWRGFLLPLMAEELGVRKAVLLKGVLWGIVHAPFVCFGLNYTGDYPGAPGTGILMMVVFATSIGIFLSWLMLKSKSIFPACIAHGVINAMREAPLAVCTDAHNVLLGPKPSGIIGMAGFLILAVVIFIRFPRSVEAS